MVCVLRIITIGSCSKEHERVSDVFISLRQPDLPLFIFFKWVYARKLGVKKCQINAVICSDISQRIPPYLFLSCSKGGAGYGSLFCKRTADVCSWCPKGSFRHIICMLIEQGLCRRKEVVHCFGITEDFVGKETALSI